MNTIEIRRLCCGYEEHPVLQDVSLDVCKGEFLGVIGPNGSGKTTLFRAITKQIQLTSGNVMLNGQDISRVSASDVARIISVVPQISELPFMFTVREFVSLGRFPHRKRFQRWGEKDKAAVDRAMSMVSVEHLMDRKVNHLSAGEKQRVFLAQALAQEPEVLLLDEPVSHLDIRHQVEILDLCRRLNAEGLTIVIILHDLNLAAEYCERIVMFHDGRIAACDVPEKVLDYQLIEKVYRTVVVVRENPISGKPFVMLISEAAMKQQRGEK